jgi:hypothetical protein
MVKFDFNLKPKKAIAYLKNKGYKLSFDHDKVIKNAHDKAFTVAKVTRADLLNDIHAALLDSMEKGTPFNEFKRDIKPTLVQKGWWGKKDITNPSTGEIKTIDIGSRRLKNIYDTNMRMAYNVAREEQMDKLPLSVYRRYDSALLSSTRDSHAKMHGIILHKDDPFWVKNSPLNGWGCKCKKRAVSLSYIKRKGWTITYSTPQDIASKDWAYDTRKGNKLSKLSKINLDKSLNDLPTISKNDKYKDLSDTEIKDKFFDDLGIVSGGVFIDKINDPMILDDELFKSLNYSKASKRDRHLYIDEFEKLISDPDEIYLEMEKLREPSEKYDAISHRLIKKFIKYYKTPKGAKKALMSLFEYQKDKTIGVSLYFINSSGTVEKKRVGKLVYQKSLKQD